MTHIDERPPLPGDEIERAKVALSLITAAKGGRDVFAAEAPLLVAGICTDDPIQTGLSVVGVLWWMAHQARVCGEEMDRLAGVGYFEDSLRNAGQYLADWPKCEDKDR